MRTIKKKKQKKNKNLLSRAYDFIGNSAFEGYSLLEALRLREDLRRELNIDDYA